MTPTCWTSTFLSAITLVHADLTEQKPKSHWWSKQEARARGLLSTRLANLTKCILYFLAPKICVKVNTSVFSLPVPSSSTAAHLVWVTAQASRCPRLHSLVPGPSQRSVKNMWLRVSSAHWLWNSWERAPPTWLTNACQNSGVSW